MSLELNKEYKEKRRQLYQMAGNPGALKSMDFKLNQEYKQVLADFNQLSAKLFLLKKLCGETGRLVRQSTKGSKR
jgi:uncharacterized protein YecT (DUF1311 family)